MFLDQEDARNAILKKIVVLQLVSRLIKLTSVKKHWIIIVVVQCFFDKKIGMINFITLIIYKFILVIEFKL